MYTFRKPEYDVALSFAGEDRDYVEGVAAALRERGFRVFYDGFEQANLWGKDLYTYLDEVYRSKARFCLMFISCHYATKVWTSHERKAAQARALLEAGEYILPVRLDDTEVPGLQPTLAYVTAKELDPCSLADLVAAKLRIVASPLPIKGVGLFVDVENIFPPMSRQIWPRLISSLKSYALSFGPLECCCAVFNAKALSLQASINLLQESNFVVVKSTGPADLALMERLTYETSTRPISTCVIATGDGDFTEKARTLLALGRVVRLVAPMQTLNPGFKRLLTSCQEARAQGGSNSEFYIDTLEQVLVSQPHNTGLNRTDTALSRDPAG